MILILAYKAIEQVGVHPRPASIVVAALVKFVFFSFIDAFTPFLYRFTWK